MILAAGMMLDHIGENAMSERITAAVTKVIAKGKVRTYDMLRLTGSPDVFKSGAATTQQMTDAVIAEL
jgi:3-isopropylmalate dehydrogenase